MGDGLKRAFAAAKATRQPKVKESGVLRACLDLLAAEHVWHMRVNTGAVKDGNRFFRFGRKGMADILALLPHSLHHWYVRPIWIEAKASDGIQRPEQIDFQREVEAYGHLYLICRSSDDLLKLLKERGVTY